MTLTCGKVAHFSAASANNHAKTLRHESGTKPNVYHCKKCDAWHVGYDSTSGLSKKGRRTRKAKKTSGTRRRLPTGKRIPRHMGGRRNGRYERSYILEEADSGMYDLDVDDIM